MERLVAQLKRVFPLKETTVTGDIVLIAAKTPEETLIYAQVGDIVRDDSRKAEWWHVTFHLLFLPPQTVVWTLRQPQFTGRESFTMGGEGRFIQALALGARPDPEAAGTVSGKGVKSPASSGKGGSALRLVK